ncbi:MAG TPA: hypothetical protein PLE35_10725, partial [Lentisphaeria bacterium]|nr:hypothetical protein [Lentisphaeria bacterium]
RFRPASHSASHSDSRKGQPRPSSQTMFFSSLLNPLGKNDRCLSNTLFHMKNVVRTAIPGS